MAAVGQFDPGLVAGSWFDLGAAREGWFDGDLIQSGGGAPPEPDLIFAAIAEAFDEDHEEPGFLAAPVAAWQPEPPAGVSSDDDHLEDEPPAVVQMPEADPPSAVAQTLDDDPEDAVDAWLSQIIESVADADEFIASIVEPLDDPEDDDGPAPAWGAFFEPQEYEPEEPVQQPTSGRPTGWNVTRHDVPQQPRLTPFRRRERQQQQALAVMLAFLEGDDR